MNPKAKEEKNKTGQGYNDARGEVPDKKDIPKNNGQNVNNDPAHQKEKEQDKYKRKGS